MRHGYHDIALPIKNELTITGKQYNKDVMDVFTDMYARLSTKEQKKLWAKYGKEIEMIMEVTNNAFKDA